MKAIIMFLALSQAWPVMATGYRCDRVVTMFRESGISVEGQGSAYARGAGLLAKGTWTGEISVSRPMPASTGELIEILQPYSVQSLAISPTGKWLAAGFSNGAVTIYDVENSLREFRHFEPWRELSWWRKLIKLPVPATALSFSHDGRQLGVGFADGRIEVHDLVHNDSVALAIPKDECATRTLLHTAFSNDGTSLAVMREACSAGEKRWARRGYAFDLGSNQLKLSFGDAIVARNPRQFVSLDFDRDGNFRASEYVRSPLGARQIVSRWSPDTGDLVSNSGATTLRKN